MFGDEYSSKLASTPAGMAHLAGTGPHGTTCGQCEFYVPAKVKNPVLKHGQCTEHRRLMRLRKCIGKIPPATRSCKYFQVKS